MPNAKGQKVFSWEKIFIGVIITTTMPPALLKAIVLFVVRVLSIESMGEMILKFERRILKTVS